jgi:hypothetical protein
MFETANIQISPEVLSLIAEIDEFKGAWRALGTLAPERLNALRRVATIESIGSSTRIEGSQLSDREVERLLANLETNPAAPAQSPVPASLFPRHYPCQQRLIAPARQNVSGRFSMAGFEVITYGRF